MKKCKEVKSRELKNWLEKEDELNAEYNALVEALEEINNIYDNEEEEEEFLISSKELIIRGYKYLNKKQIIRTGINNLLEELIEDLRKKLLLIDFYNEVYEGNLESVDIDLEVNNFGASVKIKDELKRGNKKLILIDEYELILTENNKNLFFSLSEEEKINYVIENGNLI